MSARIKLVVLFFVLALSACGNPEQALDNLNDANNTLVPALTSVSQWDAEVQATADALREDAGTAISNLVNGTSTPLPTNTPITPTATFTPEPISMTAKSLCSNTEHALGSEYPSVIQGGTLVSWIGLYGEGALSIKLGEGQPIIVPANWSGWLSDTVFITNMNDGCFQVSGK